MSTDHQTRAPALAHRPDSAIERLRHRAGVGTAQGNGGTPRPLAQLSTALDRTEAAFDAARPQSFTEVMISRLAPTASQKAVAEGEAALIRQELDFNVNVLRDWNVAGRELVASYLNALLDKASLDHTQDVSEYVISRQAELSQELYRMVGEFRRWWVPAWEEMEHIRDPAFREMQRQILSHQMEDLYRMVRLATERFMGRADAILSGGGSE